MTVVLTGYEPYGSHDRNPSAQVTEDLDGRNIAGHEIVGELLPVEFDAVGAEMRRLLELHDPSLVMATGLDAHGTVLNVERVGINLEDCGTTPDNDGRSPRDDPIYPDGPDAYMATVPVPEIVSTLLDRGIPARASTSAGTHVCNSALYTARHHVQDLSMDASVGFVHLPLTPGQAAAEARDQRPASGGDVPASLPLDLQSEAIEVTIERSLSR